MEALPALMAVVSRTVQRLEGVYGRTPDPHTPLLVPGDTGNGTMSHQRSALTGLPRGLWSDGMLLESVSDFPLYLQSPPTVADNKQNSSSAIMVTRN